MTERFSVVIVSYRPGDWLQESVSSALAQCRDVVVVDNGSVGGEAGRVAEAAGARVVRSNRNLGFAGGAALGTAAAAGEVVAFLNDDATAGPGWLESAARVLADPTVAAVTPKVVARGLYREVILDDEEWAAPGDHRPLGRQLRSVLSDGRPVLRDLLGAGVHELEQGPGGEEWRWTSGPRPFYVPVESADSVIAVDGQPVAGGPVVRVLNHAGSFLRDHGIAGEIGAGAPDDGRFDRGGEVFGFSATAPVFRAETLRRIGPFCRRFFAYNEDTDWCIRARLRGLKIVYDPAATVTHRMSATSGGTASPQVRLLAQRNALLCLLRTGPLGIAREELSARLRRGPRDPVARQITALMPWALATRAAMRRHWLQRPEDIWEQWSGRGSSWDAAPARV